MRDVRPADVSASLLRRAHVLLRCPAHPGRLGIEADALVCTACDLRLRPADGILLVSNARPDSPTHALRLMRSPVVARIYEQRWRPALVRMVSRLDYATEDALIDRHVERTDGLRVLELCSGTARAARRWLVRGAEVLALDTSMQMLVEARRRCADERLVLVQGDAARQFPQTATFDAVLCFAALHLLADPGPVLSVAAASLRPGGVFIAWALTAAGVLGPGLLPPALVRSVGLRVFAPGALGAATTAAGLEVVESFTDGAIDVVVARSPAARPAP